MLHHSFSSYIPRGIVVIASVIVIVYYLLFLFTIPYIGFEFNQFNGIIQYVDKSTLNVSPELQVGDRILAIGDHSMAEYAAIFGPSLASLISDDKFLQLTIAHGTAERTVIWPVSTPSGFTYLLRTIQMLPALTFLLAAITVFLFIRPFEQRNVLLLSSFSMGAIWLSTRLASDFNVFGSDSIYRSFVWLLIPHVFHFAWLYPFPLSALSKTAIRVFYLLFMAIGSLNFFSLLSPTAHRWGHAILGIGLSFLLITHLLHRSLLIRPVRMMFSITLLLVCLSGCLSITGTYYESNLLDSLSIFSLIGIPIAYIVPILRKSVPGFEMRTNKALVLISFTIILLILVITYNVVSPLLIDNASSQPLQSVLTVLTAVLSIILFPSYNNWAQRHLLGIRFPPKELLQQFSSQVTTSLETSRLVKVLGEDLPASLMIRQIMIIRLDDYQQPTILNQQQWLEPPSAADIPHLIEMAGSYIPHTLEQIPSKPSNQIRLVLKLSVERKIIGLVLFGRRDPDDFYSAGEISILQTLLDQAAMALLNIDQAMRLHAMYQANIQRTEAERLKIARDLHDEVLSPLGIVMMNYSANNNNQSLYDSVQDAINHIRSIIEVVRPSVLDQGLYLAIVELTNRLAEYTSYHTTLHNQVKWDTARYPLDVEAHIYRILQEACLNSIRHGKARQITISGIMKPDSIALTIQDNGDGFNSSELVDMTSLLRKRHFGLISIFERAALIGADVKIESTQNQGARVSLYWQSQNGTEASTYLTLSAQ